mmetsp:Transcript_53166/g.123783  ORF Transcript_53166/g.123783 Transcript_53166/m.123783 type:complete len:82 (+) Transcript_53166:65-310(+)
MPKSQSSETLTGHSHDAPALCAIPVPPRSNLSMTHTVHLTTLASCSTRVSAQPQDAASLARFRDFPKDAAKLIIAQCRHPP